MSPAASLAASHAAQARAATQGAQAPLQQCPGLSQGAQAGCSTSGDRETSEKHCLLDPRLIAACPEPQGLGTFQEE